MSDKLNVKQESAKDTGNARYLAEVADHGFTLEEAVFKIAETLCRRLGANECPFRGQTRHGECVATHSACPYDDRQPNFAKDGLPAVEAKPKVTPPAKK